MKSLKEYVRRRKEWAVALPNRGQLLFEEDGKLVKQIVESYEKYGFYVFKGSIGADELQDLHAVG